MKKTEKIGIKLIMTHVQIAKSGEEIKDQKITSVQDEVNVTVDCEVT